MHWLDESSLVALLFAARRLLVDPVAVLVAARPGEAPLLDAARIEQLTLEGLDADTATRLLREHGASTAHGGAERLVEATGGNPLALVELARNGADAELEPFPHAGETTAETAYRRRIDALSRSDRRLLALAAAEGSGTLATIVAAAEALAGGEGGAVAGVGLERLQQAERAGLIALSAGTLAWHHPLARSAAYRAAEPDERRALHAALASVLTHASERDRRAWQLAAAALGPDEQAAEALDGAAARARARSAHAAVAAAAARAAALSADPAARARRLFEAAEAAWLGGDAPQAERAIEQALALAPHPRLQAELDHLRGQLAIRAGALQEGYGILVAGAHAIEREDAAKAIVMLAEAADACIYLAKPARMLEVSLRAWELLGPDAGERERFFANLALGAATLYAGVGEDGATRLREALAVLDRTPALLTDPRTLSAAALAPLWLRDSTEERALIERALAFARARGALGTLPLALALIARDAATSDRPALAGALFDESAALARETGQELALCAALTWLAGVDARRGQQLRCREHVEEAMAIAGRRRARVPRAVGARCARRARAGPRRRHRRARRAGGQAAADRRARPHRPRPLARARSRRVGRARRREAARSRGASPAALPPRASRGRSPVSRGRQRSSRPPTASTPPSPARSTCSPPPTTASRPRARTSPTGNGCGAPGSACAHAPSCAARSKPSRRSTPSPGPTAPEPSWPPPARSPAAAIPARSTT